MICVFHYNIKLGLNLLSPYNRVYNKQKELALAQVLSVRYEFLVSYFPSSFL
jgi:hypothetical protein